MSVEEGIYQVDKMTGDYCPEMLGDLLPIYYRRLFPYESYCRWLGAGNVDKSYLARREFSFTLEGDIYLRLCSAEAKLKRDFPNLFYTVTKKKKKIACVSGRP